jgi:hypothetical protein
VLLCSLRFLCAYLTRLDMKLLCVYRTCPFVCCTDLQQAKNLPGMDWWNGLADPYVIITALPPGEQGIQYT